MTSSFSSPLAQAGAGVSIPASALPFAINT